MMCSVYKLDKQGDNKQPCHTSFSILNQSVVPCNNFCFLTHIQVSQEAGNIILPLRYSNRGWMKWYILWFSSFGRNQNHPEDLLKQLIRLYSLSFWFIFFQNVSYSVTKLHLTLCDPMNYSMPAFPILHYFPEFAQIHVHWVGNAI